MKSWGMSVSLRKNFLHQQSTFRATNFQVQSSFLEPQTLTHKPTSFSDRHPLNLSRTGVSTYAVISSKNGTAEERRVVIHLDFLHLHDPRQPS